jgi:hypothetical protein
LDVAGVAQIAVNRELSAQEGRAQLSNQFLRCIGPRAEAVSEIAVKTRLMSRPVTEFVKRGAVKVRSAREGLETRKADEIVARPVIRFAEALPDRRADQRGPRVLVFRCGRSVSSCSASGDC